MAPILAFPPATASEDRGLSRSYPPPNPTEAGPAWEPDGGPPSTASELCTFYSTVPNVL